MLTCAHHSTKQAVALVTLSLLQLRGNALNKTFKMSLCAHCAAAFKKCPELKHLDDLRRITGPTPGIIHELELPTQIERTN